AVQLDPSSVIVWRCLGWCHYRTGNWRDSVEALEKSCKLQRGGTGDCGQGIVLALGHARLAAEPGAGAEGGEDRPAGGRGRYEQADKQIDGWWPRSTDDPELCSPAIWDFREEARKLMGANGNKK